MGNIGQDISHDELRKHHADAVRIIHEQRKEIEALKAVVKAAGIPDWVIANPEKTPKVADGTPGVRDPDAICEEFEPGDPNWVQAGCFGDGHYLCQNCTQYIPKDGEE